MVNKFFAFSVCMALLLGTSQSLFADARCKPLKFDSLKQMVAAQKTKRKLIFFASWCSDCAHSIKNAGDDDYLIASFDEEKAASKVIEKANVKALCFLDVDIAENFGVKFVPDVRMINF